MPSYSIRFLAKKEVAEKTMAFFFEKPKGFKFVPGQFIEITLNKDAYPFSIASSPKEKDLMLTTRMRPKSKFKKTLGKLKIGTRVKIEGPFGQFVLHQNKRIPAVFLAGGIGITPFRSIIKTFPNRKITLFHSNRKKKDTPFLEELKTLQSKNFKLVTIMTRQGDRHLSPKILKDSIKKWRKVPIGKANRGSSISRSDIGTIYYAVGSTGFVQSMTDMLSKMKIKPENIKTENFPGY